MLKLINQAIYDARETLEDEVVEKLIGDIDSRYTPDPVPGSEDDIFEFELAQRTPGRRLQDVVQVCREFVEKYGAK